MSLRIATGTDGPSKGAQGLKEKICSICRTCAWTYPYSRTFCRLWKEGCESGNATDKIVTSSAQTENGNADVDLSIFAAKSLNGVMDEICAAYTKAASKCKLPEQL